MLRKLYTKILKKLWRKYEASYTAWYMVVKKDILKKIVINWNAHIKLQRMYLIVT